MTARQYGGLFLLAALVGIIIAIEVSAREPSWEQTPPQPTVNQTHGGHIVV